MPVTIYHNPRCSTSRKVLAAIREHGIEPVIVEYLNTPPDRQTLEGILAAAGLEPGQLLRRKEALAAELGLNVPDASREKILAAMLKHPILIERPIVITDKGASVCRPPERVEALL